MSDPQLRCLLCDLILAEEGRTDYPTETCKQCGRKVLAGQTGGEAEADLQPLNPPPSRAKPLDLDIDLLPEAAVVPPPPASRAETPPPLPADDIPSVPVLSKARRVEDDVPTVQPRGKITTDPANVPYAARRSDAPPARPTPPPPPPTPAARPVSKLGPNFPARKITIPDPSRVPDAQPRPKVLQAFAILGCMTLLGVIAVTIIIACIVIGLLKAANKAEAPRPGTPVVEHRG